MSTKKTGLGALVTPEESVQQKRVVEDKAEEILRAFAPQDFCLSRS
jgi:hypothetical protein